ncbi:RecB family exonuclease [Marmoricola sp. RAF53]|uniref:RecB family exonuclease n=1 Tax=Marmoricola sp. RAF53 TaxID=3233059 RepID=UPI003F9CB9C2
MVRALDERTRGTEVDGVAVLGALSPSRAGDFKTCPLLYRFRTVDRLPEPPSRDAARGTVVHKVLEDLFDLPATDRTPERAEELVAAAWAQVQELEPQLASLFGAPQAEPGEELAAWLQSCRTVLRRYFDLEDPRRLEPAEREQYVETVLDSRLLLRGYVDRVDVAADGAIRIADYKTSRAPAAGFEARALFQMRFYALVLWRTRGVVPAVLRLLYLGDGQIVEYAPDEQDLRATERQLEALWAAIALARETGDWQPHRSPLCGWCSFQALCPEFGGTPPPLPASPRTARSEGDDAAADLAGGGTDGPEDDPVGP